MAFFLDFTPTSPPACRGDLRDGNGAAGLGPLGRPTGRLNGGWEDDGDELFAGVTNLDEEGFLDESEDFRRSSTEESAFPCTTVLEAGDLGAELST